MEHLKYKKLIQTVSEEDVWTPPATLVGRIMDEFAEFVGNTIQEWLFEENVKLKYAHKYFKLNSKRVNKIHRKFWEKGLKVEIKTITTDDGKVVTRIYLCERK
jgi:hypothetical protein|nr:MAG TPA: hypothetical protein [Bacteriophage sp.]